jgi:putative ABC transport system ATP-binding protein
VPGSGRPAATNGPGAAGSTRAAAGSGDPDDGLGWLSLVSAPATLLAPTRVRAASIGFIFQTFNLIPTLSALENVEAALVPLGTGKDEREARAAEALQTVGLGERLRHLPGELSGGQQQRVAIARALVKQPRVVLADEPTGNLDEDTRDDIMGLLEHLWRDTGMTLVLVTHDSAVARRAQRIGITQHGKLSIRQDTRARRPERPGRAAQGARPGPDTP